MTAKRTFVGFGFGAIQAGLFLYEAYQSGAFSRLVVAEVMPQVVAAVREAGGYFSVNVAHTDRIETVRVGPVQMENPAEREDRQRLIDAVADAHEIATAVPSVAYYVSQSAGSLHRILAEGLRKKAAQGGASAIIYTAENHIRAAEILEEHVLSEVPPAERDRVSACVRFLNTVIGKMSGVVTDADELRSQRLASVTPTDPRAFLVEAFNHIYISRIRFEETFNRGIAVFEEKDNLAPFEETKLYGHNATHALAAYMGQLRGLSFISDFNDDPAMMAFLRAALVGEAGAALMRKYAGVDPLFTAEGFAAYTDDLLGRMVNPNLRDTVQRVGRDPARKLGWDDRLIGTIRLALSQNVEPRRYAFGAAAALAALDIEQPQTGTFRETLTGLWKDAADPDERARVLAWVEKGVHALRRWQDAGYSELESALAGMT